MGLFLIGLLACAQLSAQRINLSDSLSHIFKEKKGLSAKYDGKNAMVSGRNSKTNSIKLGVSFGKRFSMGLGYNWLSTDITQLNILERKEQFVKLRYIAPYAEYIFFRKNNWEASIPVQIGVGKSFLSYEKNGSGERVGESWTWLYEPSMTIEYKFFGMVGVGVGGGYRIMLKNNRNLDTQFTSPIYTWRVRLIFEEIFRKTGLKWPEKHS